MRSTLRFSVGCLAVLALFALSGCDSKSAQTGSVQAEVRVGAGAGVINAERIFEESEAGKAGVAYLNSISEEMQKELGKLQKAAQDNENKEEAEAALQKGFLALQQRFNAEQQQVMNKLNEHFLQATETCRKNKNLAIIIDASTAVSYDEKADLTGEVITIMNGQAISFTPIAPEGEAALPASDGAVPAEATAPAVDAAAPDANATAQ